MDVEEQLKPALDMYVPSRGEGNSMASQALTAVNKLYYMWYNNGDVFDCTNRKYAWGNNISSYANWLYTYTQCGSALSDVKVCTSDEEYEEILDNVGRVFLDKDYVEYLAKKHAVGSIYSCPGPFQCDHGAYTRDWNDPDDEDGWLKEDEGERYSFYDKKTGRKAVMKPKKKFAPLIKFKKEAKR